MIDTDNQTLRNVTKDTSFVLALMATAMLMNNKWNLISTQLLMIIGFWVLFSSTSISVHRHRNPTDRYSYLDYSFCELGIETMTLGMVTTIAYVIYWLFPGLGDWWNSWGVCLLGFTLLSQVLSPSIAYLRSHR